MQHSLTSHIPLPQKTNAQYEIDIDKPRAISIFNIVRIYRHRSRIERCQIEQGFENSDCRKLNRAGWRPWQDDRINFLAQSIFSHWYRDIHRILLGLSYEEKPVEWCCESLADLRFHGWVHTDRLHACPNLNSSLVFAGEFLMLQGIPPSTSLTIALPYSFLHGSNFTSAQRQRKTSRMNQP